jgi:hypothetical protein
MISNEEAIYNKLCSEYPNAIKSITDLSLNDTGNRNFLVSSVTGFDYDQVLNVSDCYKDPCNEKSPDALFFHDGKLYFIEFKEGGVDKQDIRCKIHEGVNTLYVFAKKHIPGMNRQTFVELNINYAVFMRDTKRTLSNSSFRAALDLTSNKFSLKNLEGFIVKKTRVAMEPQDFVDFFHRITSGAVKSIDVFEHLGQPKLTTFNVTPPKTTVAPPAA